MTQQLTRICILGGGFGGLYTALRLSQLPWEKSQQPEIILIDRNDRFLFLPLLYELVTGELQSWEIAPPYQELLANTGVRFIQATVTGIDIDKQSDSRGLGDKPRLAITLTQNSPLPETIELNCDRLVLALGGETPLDKVPGASELAIPFHSLSHAYRLEERLRILEESEAEKIRVAVVGGGYSGVEIACKVAERLSDRGRVRIIERGDKILGNSPDFNREAARKALKDRNIWIDLETEVQSITSNQISLLYKGQVDTIPVDIVLWTVGTRISPIISALPLKQSQRGKLTIAPTLQVIDRPEIFALGDIVDCQDATGEQIPNTAQSAFQQADYTAWNIWASLTNRPLLPFRYQHLGEMMTLGTDNATLTGLGLQLDGTLGYLLRRLIYLYRMPTLEHQLKVGFNWIAQPLLDLLSGKI
ncbi:MAG TPA: FAD-dependent oxidoreductase [Cyanobacteria bacterium UBA11149]|nr:FAD-dependent oxidoreductase [Cyanobacteria bacterium UBA11367]HBE61040.1 FAD-dependent oxidoreductase [Cyanobacteria bacterium UBA11366]HBK65738.1 FAD-dependent oxidoreductase [Cyanobacteria bacterium UBA11166]HBR72500.1 FAD-dependent oxidoreductase [Cyanobacteria bacterium UBA11159]HBS70995.1 FAD-dependent oxidoreductase [Cyanobacteria bacterium UBA11153]HBW90863.1 FAD-dependent oxidoreductase [Cyanobacteria bacterium UBA11149]HCA95811.1 FAD-dependent oxidoreductase [Cyanobacteria bacter